MIGKRFLVSALVMLIALFILSNSTTWAACCDSCHYGTIVPVYIPKTGQTTCYNSDGGTIVCEGTGQDGELQKGVEVPPTDTRFTLLPSNKTVRDNLTGLMWTKNANLRGIDGSWQQALDYVTGMNAGAGTYGYKDWRLPNIRELLSLVDYGKGESTTDPTVLPIGHPFKNVQLGKYWSSTNPWTMLWCIGMGDGWVENFYDPDRKCYFWPVRSGHCDGNYDNDRDVDSNDIITYNTDYSYNLCRSDFNCDEVVNNDDTTIFLESFGRNIYNDPCPYFRTLPKTGNNNDLRGVCWPNPRFEDNGDGTVTDNLTGLIWLKNTTCVEGETWAELFSNVHDLANGNEQCALTDDSSVGDWRIPNIREQLSLVDYNSDHLRFRTVVWPTEYFDNIVIGLHQNYYPTSTTAAKETSDFWGICSTNGDISHDSTPKNGGFAWPVRDP